MQSRISQFWRETLDRLHATEQSLTKILQAYQQLQELQNDRTHHQSIFNIEDTSKHGEEELDSAEKAHADLVRSFSKVHADHLASLLNRVAITTDAAKTWQVAEEMVSMVEKYVSDARELHGRRIASLHDHYTAMLGGLHRELHACCQGSRQERHQGESRRKMK